METTNIVFVGTSIDGYIADQNEGLEFLECVPNPEQNDLGFTAFMESVDAVLMGRKTLEMVLSFGFPWHYSKPVFVLSSTMASVPDDLQGKVEIVNGSLEDVVRQLNAKGFRRLYIDGGQLIQGFLREDMIDEMIITRVPILLGGGIPLFADVPEHSLFEHVGTEILLDQLVTTRYRRKR